MKSSKSKTHTKVHKIPTLYFEKHHLTSFSGIIIFQALFQKLDLKNRLKACFSTDNRTYGVHISVLLLIVHMILGNRRLRDMDYYNDDPLICRTLGLSKLPDVSTVSRSLSNASEKNYEAVKSLSRDIVLKRLKDSKTKKFHGSR